MFDFVPIYNYTHYFDISILILVLIAVWQCSRGSIFHKDVVEFNATWGFVFAVVLILYMGLRPIDGQFGDTVIYASGFREASLSKAPFVWQWRTEWLFQNLVRIFAKYSDVHTFFLFCSFLYVGSLWWAMQRIFKSYYYIPLLVIFSMFTFWNYGVNGIRNGIGASLFILAMTYVQNLPVAMTLSFIAMGFHTSILLMAGAAIAAWFIKNSYIYLMIWILAIPASYVLGNTFQNIFAGIDIIGGDDRLYTYLTQETDESNMVYVSHAFRWDYILYSAMGTITGYYFIFRRLFKDEYYHWIFNVYLITNAFWILIIRAAFSNRFAQISWFILPIVLIYPFMKKRFWLNHEKMLGYALLIFYAYAFYYNILR